jgi:hypothetical protein
MRDELGEYVLEIEGSSRPTFQSCEEEREEMEIRESLSRAERRERKRDKELFLFF